MSRGVTTDWMLRELDVPHEKIIIDTSAGKQNTPEYRAIDPMGKLPALIDGQKIVAETAAICAYLTEKFVNKRFAPKINSAERAAYYRCLFIPGTKFEPVFSLAAVGFEHSQSESAGWGGRERVVAIIETMCPNDGWAPGGEFSTDGVIFGGFLAFSMVFN